MKTCFIKRILGFCLAALLASIFASSVYANEFIVGVGTPDQTKEGSVTLTITALAPSDDENETPKPEPVVITIPINTSAEIKAGLIKKAITDNATLKKQFVTAEVAGTTVTIGNVSTVSGVDQSGEKTKFYVVKRPQIATLDFHLFTGSELSGIDQQGLESNFQSSFGFDGTVADASFKFSDLSANTIDALLTDTYNAFLADLAPAYWSNLSLDLFNDEISFAFPIGSSNGFVENFTSDVNAFSSLSLATTVPEPSTLSLWALLAFGLVITRSNRTS